MSSKTGNYKIGNLCENSGRKLLGKCELGPDEKTCWTLAGRRRDTDHAHTLALFVRVHTTGEPGVARSAERVNER